MLQIGPLIAWLIIAAIVAGSLLHLLTRSSLAGHQKLVALLVSLMISLPAGGLLVVVVWVFLGGALWDMGFSDMAAAVILFGPLPVVLGIAIIVAGNTANRRESRKAAQAKDGPSG